MRELNRLDRGDDFGLLRVVAKDVVLHFLVIHKAEFAVRALPNDLVHALIILSAAQCG
jgi:hypothetical protein